MSERNGQTTANGSDQFFERMFNYVKNSLKRDPRLGSKFKRRPVFRKDVKHISFIEPAFIVVVSQSQKQILFVFFLLLFVVN